jgi:hypothetical protein
MEYEFTWLTFSLLVASGVIAGFINTLAGGGSLLTLPALMLLGMPADIANGTNRIAVLLQSLEGMRGFHSHGKLARDAIVPILAPTLGGSLVGALVASFLPAGVLKPVLLTTLMVMALIMVLRPGTVSPGPDEQPRRLRDTPSGYFWLFGAGLYGGFIQAGVGFVLITALAGVLRYDLVRANALKLTCTAVFGAVSLAVFVTRDQVLWIPGLVLAAGSVVGVRLSVRLAVNVSQRALRWFLLFMVLAVSIAAWFG